MTFVAILAIELIVTYKYWYIVHILNFNLFINSSVIFIYV